jgi:chromosome segregation ATPase
MTFIRVGLNWLRKSWVMLRELRTHEQQLLSQRDLLARELRHDAEIAERFEQGHTEISSVQREIKTAKWDQFGAQWSALRKRHLDLWNEIADAYDALEHTKGRGAAPVASGVLSDLASRLEQAEI